MLNIFNLFLFLLLLWVMLMLSSGNVTWAYLVIGIFCTTAISFLSFRLKLIKKDSELLYLSLGFYRHFAEIFFRNIFKAWYLIFDLALNKKPMRPLLYSIKHNKDHKYNLALMAITLNMSTGLFCIGVRENNFYVHAIEEKYFEAFDVFKTNKILLNVNDDNLV